jgi:hypothetical protein
MTNDEEPTIKAAGGWCMPSGMDVETGTYTLGYAKIAKRTPEEWAAIRAKQKARVEARFAEAFSRWLEVTRRIKGGRSDGSMAWALLSIAERHAPKAGSYEVECSCWHDNGYETEPASWPCPDIRDVAIAVGITLPRNDDE